mmetsp:Transcript_113723/g.226327  ORF Transcript_113723/g.226327 Transcript_113723/m.226327 type:complete len:203 (-) Transcript_113723:235-843(-)
MNLDRVQSCLRRHTGTVAANGSCTECAMAVIIHSAIIVAFARLWHMFECFERGHSTSSKFLMRGADACVHNVNVHINATFLAHGLETPIQALSRIDAVKAPRHVSLNIIFQFVRFLTILIKVHCCVRLHIGGILPVMHRQFLQYPFPSALHDKKTKSTAIWVSVDKCPSVVGHVRSQGFEVPLPAPPIRQNDPLTSPFLCHV